MTPIPVTTGMLDDFLPFLAWHFAEFTKGGQISSGTMIEQLRSGQRQLWVAWEDGIRCAVLTMVLDDLRKTVLVSHGAGEGMQDWVGLWPVIEDWARDIGADCIEVNARPGWERVLRDYGLKKTHVVLEKRL